MTALANNPSAQGQESTIPQASRAQAFLFWLKLGFISFGGPAGQIAIMHQELVDKRHWISEKRFLHALNYCMMLPGPEAQQLATYIGWLLHRTWGGVWAGILFVLPSLFILIALSWLYVAHGHLGWVAGLFYGLKPAVTAIVLQAAYRIGTRALKSPWLYLIAIAAFVAISLGLPFPLIILSSAVAGLLGGRWFPERFPVARYTSPAHGAENISQKLIDDTTPPPPHTRFTWRHASLVLFTCVSLYALPMALVVYFLGLHHPFAQMGWFFTTSAFLTFGGAYALLPYIFQGAVHHFSWLSTTQMMDGLALGETTPGPLIMVVAFVAYLAGYNGAMLGPDHLFLAGTLAALLVTWVTFLPSFLFIFLGGPLIEGSRNALYMIRPLSAITAAVVGMILNLSLFFAQHTLWPQGSPPIDKVALCLMCAAFIALFFYRLNVIMVLLFCGLAGLLYRMML